MRRPVAEVQQVGQVVAVVVAVVEEAAVSAQQAPRRRRARRFAVPANGCAATQPGDVTISGSQKGLMLPPGISFNALSPKALEASRHATLPKSFWAWDEIVEMNRTGYWPYTPNTNLLYGLAEAIEMARIPLRESGVAAAMALLRSTAVPAARAPV